MGTYNIHAGHCPQGQGASGAAGILLESVENRIVKNSLIQELRDRGHTVYDTTDDSNCTERENLYRIVNKCNQHTVDADISVHLNSGRKDYEGDGKTGGVEVLVTGYWQDMIIMGNNICEKISQGLGITNRGVKVRKDLYVLNHTNSHSLLIECCFVDDKDDAVRWDAKLCGRLVAEAVAEGSVDPGEKPQLTVPSVDKGKITLNIDGSWGTQTSRRTQQYFRTEIDGIVSFQPQVNRIYLPNVWSGSWEFYDLFEEYQQGSQVIRALQNFLKVSGHYNDIIDGWCGKETVIAFQRFLSTEKIYTDALDGSMGTNTVSAWQRWLNKC